MSGDLSNYGAAHFARCLFGKSETPIANYYLALINGKDPSGFITGAELDEVSGGAYARKVIPNNTASWNERDYGRMATIGVLLFPVATTKWGRIRSWALLDASTGGNILFYGQFRSAKFIQSGDRFTIANGGVSVELMAGI